MVVVLGTGWLVYHLYQTHYPQALGLFILAQILFVTSMVWLTSSLLLSTMVFLPIVIAGGLAGPIGASVAAVAVIGVELGLAFALVHGLSTDAALVAGGSV